MTNAEVENMLHVAREKGRDIEAIDVRFFLGAKKLLAADASNEAAKEVVQNFLDWMRTGVETPSFTKFTLPMAIIHTDEEIAEREYAG